MNSFLSWEGCFLSYEKDKQNGGVVKDYCWHEKKCAGIGHDWSRLIWEDFDHQNNLSPWGKQANTYF